jgi:hypothetical protein
VNFFGSFYSELNRLTYSRMFLKSLILLTFITIVMCQQITYNMINIIFDGDYSYEQEATVITPHPDFYLARREQFIPLGDLGE